MALGATAIRALAGKPLPVTRSCGPALLEGRAGFVTVHPCCLLRIRDPDDRARAYAGLVADLSAAKRLADQAAGGR